MPKRRGEELQEHLENKDISSRPAKKQKQKQKQEKQPQEGLQKSTNDAAQCDRCAVYHYKCTGWRCDRCVSMRLRCTRAGTGLHCLECLDVEENCSGVRDKCKHCEKAKQKKCTYDRPKVPDLDHVLAAVIRTNPQIEEMIVNELLNSNAPGTDVSNLTYVLQHDKDKWMKLRKDWKAGRIFRLINQNEPVADQTPVVPTAAPSTTRAHTETQSDAPTENNTGVVPEAAPTASQDRSPQEFSFARLDDTPHRYPNNGIDLHFNDLTEIAPVASHVSTAAGYMGSDAGHGGYGGVQLPPTRLPSEDNVQCRAALRAARMGIHANAQMNYPTRAIVGSGIGHSVNAFQYNPPGTYPNRRIEGNSEPIPNEPYGQVPMNFAADAAAGANAASFYNQTSGFHGLPGISVGNQPGPRPDALPGYAHDSTHSARSNDYVVPTPNDEEDPDSFLQPIENMSYAEFSRLINKAYDKPADASADTDS